MINKAVLVGNVGADPQSRRSAANGRDVVSLSLATSRQWKDRASGERRKATEWHRVVIFSEPLGRVALDYVRRGSRLYVEGEIRTRKWSDRAGVERTVTEIVLMDYVGRLELLDRRAAEGAPPADSADDYGGAEEPPRPADELNDEIPF